MLPTILLCNTKSQAKAYLKNHLLKEKLVEIYNIEPLGEKFKIEQIRQLKKQLATASDRKKVVILWWFDTASIEAQNSSLKMLEEKSDEVDFFLVAKNVNNFLPTIVSRCRTVDLREKTTDLEFDDFSFLINGELKLFDMKTKSEAVKFLEKFLAFFRQRAKENLDGLAADVCKKVLEVKNYIENNNLNPQLAIDFLLIFTWKKYKMVNNGKK